MVLGRGTTVLAGPYSYTIVMVNQIDDAKYLVGKETLDTNSIIYAHEPLPIEVPSGRVVLFAYAFKQEDCQGSNTGSRVLKIAELLNEGG